MRSARTDFHVVRLQQRAALLVPVILQRQDDLLKAQTLAELWCRFMPACGRDVGAKSEHMQRPWVICESRILRVFEVLRHPDESLE